MVAKVVKMLIMDRLRRKAPSKTIQTPRRYKRWGFHQGGHSLRSAPPLPSLQNRCPSKNLFANQVNAAAHRIATVFDRLPCSIKNGLPARGESPL